MSLLDCFLDEDQVAPSPLEIFISIRNDNAKGSGTKGDPFNGNTDLLLDPILNAASEHSAIRFGPGIFRTKGSGAELPGWVPKSGQKFIGAGTNQTVLQLVKATFENRDRVFDVGVIRRAESNVYTDDIEISDMTIDVNLSRQPLTAAGMKRFMKGQAITIYGKNIKVRRVRIINWGTYVQNNECFPIFLESQNVPAAGTNVVEDCIIEQPDLSPSREETMLNNHAQPNSPQVFCTNRNNYINGDFTTGTPPPAIAVVSLETDTVDTSKMRLRTQWPHGLIVRDQANYFGDEVYVSGSPVAELNGRFAVRQVVDEFTIQFDKPSYSGNPFAAGITAQRYVPRAMRIAPGALTSSGLVATLECPVPHLRTVDDYIRVSGVLVNGSPNNPFNGSFKVDWV